MNAISLRETFDQIVFVFPSAFNEIASNSDIERPVSFADWNINCWLSIIGIVVLDSRMRGNDDCEAHPTSEPKFLTPKAIMRSNRAQ